MFIPHGQDNAASINVGARPVVHIEGSDTEIVQINVWRDQDHVYSSFHEQEVSQAFINYETELLLSISED